MIGRIFVISSFQFSKRIKATKAQNGRRGNHTNEIIEFEKNVKIGKNNMKL